MAWATHVYCEKCWSRRNPGRESARLKAEFAKRSPCCVCGEVCDARIFVREESATLKCKGLGPNHVGDD